MDKTYSVCILVGDKLGLNNGQPYWVTNWNEYASLDDINWDRVKEHCIEYGELAYGYVYGQQSSHLTTDQTILWQAEQERED